MYKIFPKETQEVARLIGLFYLEKNNNDYVATEEEIKRLQITDIEVEHCEIIVELSRPGLFIGKRGENVEQLQKYLHEHGFKRKLHIKEAKQNILDFLVPYEYNDEDLGFPSFEDEIQMDIEELCGGDEDYYGLR